MRLVAEAVQDEEAQEELHGAAPTVGEEGGSQQEQQQREEEGAPGTAEGDSEGEEGEEEQGSSDEGEEEEGSCGGGGGLAAAAATAAAAAQAGRRRGRRHAWKKAAANRRRRRTPVGVHVTLLSKLLWGCAHLGYIPPADLLQQLTDAAQWALSHSRARGTVSAAQHACCSCWLPGAAAGRLCLIAPAAPLHSCARALARSPAVVVRRRRRRSGVQPCTLYLPLPRQPSHSPLPRSRPQVLHVTEAVRLLWALAVLEQYHTALFRNLAFRASRMPHGVPRQQDSVQLLHQVRAQWRSWCVGHVGVGGWVDGRQRGCTCVGGWCGVVWGVFKMKVRLYWFGCSGSGVGVGCYSSRSGPYHEKPWGCSRPMPSTGTLWSLQHAVTGAARILHTGTPGPASLPSHARTLYTQSQPRANPLLLYPSR